MSGYLRFCVANFVLVGVLRRHLRFPIRSLKFNLLLASPLRALRPRRNAWPDSSLGAGQRWMYRRDGHGRCWFLAEGVATVRKPSRVANRSVRPSENETIRQKPSPVTDAHAELLSSATAGEAQPS